MIKGRGSVNNPANRFSQRAKHTITEMDDELSYLNSLARETEVKADRAKKYF